MIKCKGMTLKSKKCSRNALTNKDYCFQHFKNSFAQDKPTECIICCESLVNQKKSLNCGHWIHFDCIVNSAKAECPICRSKLQLPKILLNRIELISKQRRDEVVAEESEEIRRIYGEELSDFLESSLLEQITLIISDIISDSDDINIINMMDLFDD